MKVKIIKDVDQPDMHPFKAGQEADVDPFTAQELIQKGFAEGVGLPVPPRVEPKPKDKDKKD